jgi:predicted metalloprotease with PDZ domain
MSRTVFRVAAVWIALSWLAAPAIAQSGTPIKLSVDATDAPRKILRVHEVVPATTGPFVLYYPKWIQGVHAPIGPVMNVTGLKISANHSTLPWKRDARDIYTFHVDVPTGARALDIAFDYLIPPDGGGAVGGTATSKFMDLNWYQVVLYPAGTPARQITVEPQLMLPTGWKFGSALPVASQTGATISFRPIALDRLLDSPVIAGEFLRVWDITPPGEPIHHEIDVVADSEEALAMPDDVHKGLTNLVAESGKIFGARHYSVYHFLLTLSEHTVHFGVEHHESNDSRLPERVLISPGAAREIGGLLAHEFAHSWSGKFRRPTTMAPDDFQTPLETDLLWVYEGNTSFLGDLLAARSGLWTADEYRQALAGYAASLGPGRPGRTWRPLIDTAVAVPGVFTGGPDGGGWGNWRRGLDYYEEGELLWLEAATVMHDRSKGQRSLDDFFRAFYGGPNNGAEIKAYTLDELVQTMNQVVPYDWANFWNTRLTSTSADAPTGGIEASGWKLTFTPDMPAPARGGRGLSASTFTLGLSLSPDGHVNDATYGGPAFKAGVTSGMKIAAVNGRVFTPEILEDAIKRIGETARPIEFLVIVDDYYKTITIDYKDGARYPHLVRNESKPDYLETLLKPAAR